MSPVGVSGTKGNVEVICEKSLCERKLNAFSDIITDYQKKRADKNFTFGVSILNWDWGGCVFYTN